MGLAAAPGRSHHRRRRPGRLLFSSVPTAVLLGEADELVADRRWRAASDVLAAAAATTVADNERRQVLERLAVTSAHAGRHDVSSEAVFQLQEMRPRTADTWVAFGQVALARRNYEHADAAARSALVVDPDHHGAWAVMAASFAGLGWFDEAQHCLDRIDIERIDDVERWRIGRAVNRWALRGGRLALAAALSMVVVGILALAVFTAVPLVSRRWRLRALAAAPTTNRLAAWAGEAWRLERRLRCGYAVVIISSIAAWIATLAL